MTSCIVFASIAFVADCAVRASTAAANTPRFRVGGAYRDITPTEPMVNYNGRIVKPDPDATPLRVHVIVCDDGEKRAAIVSVDCTFLGRSEILRVRDALRWRVGIQPDFITVAATHSHAAPATTASFLSGALPDPRYLDLVTEQICQAAETAFARLQPARLAAASVRMPPFAACRRRISPEGQAYFTGAEPDPAFPAENPIEQELQYIVFEAQDGRALAAIFAIACHNNMVSSVYSGDFFGRTGDALRDRLGDIATVSLAAPCGDVNYILPGKKRFFADDREAGAALAKTILDSLPQAVRRDATPLVIRSMVRRIPDRPFDPAEFAYDNGRGTGSAALASHRARYAPEEIAVQKLGPTGCDVEIQAIAFGSVAIVTNPAELFSVYGMRIRERSPFAITLVSSITNGYCGYVPTVQSFKHRGYETYRTVYTSRLAKDAGEQITEASVELLTSIPGR